MTESTRPPKKAGRRWLRRLLVLAVFFAAVWLLAGWLLGRSLDAELRDYPGPSLETDAFVPPPLPDGTPNAWDAVTAAVLLLDGQEAISGDGGVRVRQPDPEVQAIVDRLRQLDREREQPGAADLELFRTRLNRFAMPLAVLDHAFENAREARFDTDYTVPTPLMRIPNFLASLRLASLLRARAELAAAEGRAEAAWHDAALLYRLAYWDGRATHTLIGALVARAVSRQGDLAVQSLLGRIPASPATRASLLAEAGRLDPAPYFSRVFAAERAAMYQALLDPRLTRKDFGFSADPEHDGWDSPTALLFDWKPWRRFNAAHYLTWARRADQICGTLSYQQQDAPAQLKAATIPDWIRPAALLSFDCLDSSQKRDMWQASRDFLEIAFALEAWREQNGAYPPHLAALDPALAARIDPFSGKPYRYLPESGGYRLYSIGVNGKDDGGQQVFKPEGQVDPAQGDWVWQVKAAPAAP